MGRIIAIGDVHGCSQELQELLDKLSPQNDDHIVFLGDLVNRGPDSLGALDIACSFKNATYILGNHELRLLNYRKTKNKKILKSCDLPTLKCLRDQDWELFESMQPTLYVKEFDTVFVHGGFAPGTPWHEQSKEVVCNVQVIGPQGQPLMRDKHPQYPFWANFWHGPPFVVYGHTPRPKVERHTWSLGIDTACVNGHFLTAYVLPQKEIIQVAAHKNYAE